MLKMRGMRFFLPALACLFLSGCLPYFGEGPERPMFKNARVLGYTEEGVPLFEKEWRKKKQHGIWRSFHPNGQVHEESSFQHGEKHGVWKTFYANGQLRSVGEWRAGKQEGLAEAWHENGKRAFSAEYKDGLQHGWARTWNEVGEKTEEIMWKNGAPDPEMDMLSPKGSL